MLIYVDIYIYLAIDVEIHCIIILRIGMKLTCKLTLRNNM